MYNPNSCVHVPESVTGNRRKYYGSPNGLIIVVVMALFNSTVNMFTILFTYVPKCFSSLSARPFLAKRQNGVSAY